MARRNFMGGSAGAASGAVLGACGGAAAPLADDSPPAPARTVPDWNRLALQAIQRTRPALPVAAHALAVLHTCMYNAWAAYDDAARQTVHGVAVRLPRLERSAASKASAMSHAAYFTLCDRFPSQKPVFDARMAELGLAPAQAAGQLTPAGIGRTQAERLAEAQRGLGEPAPGAPHSADPPCGDAGVGHWWRLAHYVARRDGHDDDRDVLLYVLLAQALADAAMAVHKVRKVREVGETGQAPCPGQVCGHSALGAAAAEVLRRFTGSDRLAAGPAARGGAIGFDAGPAPGDLAPAWASFSEAAEQAGLACIQGGTCATAAQAAGLELGRQLGAQAFDQARRYWQGKL